MNTDQQDLSSLSPDQIHSLAMSLAKRDERDRHWSRLAQIIGHVEAYRLYETETFGRHASIRSWALDDLNLGADDVGLLRRFFQMMLDHQSAIPLDEWRDLSKGKAQVLLKVAKLGATPEQMRRWFDAAMPVATSAFEEKFREYVGDEVWVSLGEVPKETAALFDRALECFLADVLGDPEPDPKRVHDREVRHQCIERMASEVIGALGKQNAA